MGLYSSVLIGVIPMQHHLETHFCLQCLPALPGRHFGVCVPLVADTNAALEAILHVLRPGKIPRLCQLHGRQVDTNATGRLL